MKSYQIILIVVLFIFTLVLYKIWTYPFPGEKDFRKNEERYIRIASTLLTSEFQDVQSIWGGYIQLKDSKTTYYKWQVFYPKKYISLEDEILLIDDNTFFTKCPNGIIKISKWWWLNNFFEVVYVYSRNGFPILPSRTREKINEHVILYHNYSDTYTADEICQLK